MSKLKDVDVEYLISNLLAEISAIQFSPISIAAILYALVLLAELLKLYYSKMSHMNTLYTGASIAGEVSKCDEIRLLISIRNALVHGKTNTAWNQVRHAFENVDTVVSILREHKNIPDILINLYLFCSAHKNLIRLAYVSISNDCGSC